MSATKFPEHQGYRLPELGATAIINASRTVVVIKPNTVANKEATEKCRSYAQLHFLHLVARIEPSRLQHPQEDYVLHC